MVQQTHIPLNAFAHLIYFRFVVSTKANRNDYGYAKYTKIKKETTQQRPTKAFSANNNNVVTFSFYSQFMVQRQ